jgi:hypothetical protein
MITKVCTKCGVRQPISEFHAREASKGGRQPLCKACDTAQRKERRAKNPEQVRMWNLRNKYGLTMVGYQELMERQGGGCAVCGATPAQNGRVLAVDHDHACCPGVYSCGKCVRGLLCHHCNTGLGHFVDSPERLEAAAAYLRARQRD